MKLTLRASALPMLGLAASLLLQSASAFAASRYRVLHDFGSGQDGPAIPSGPPFLGASGNLYGNTYSETFELSPQSNGAWQETILHTFATADGTPYGVLIADEAGDVYGTTAGGPDSNSVIFELSPSPGDWNFNALYTDGAGPGLVSDKLGNLYGDVGPGIRGYGAIGELSPGSGTWTYAALADFSDTLGYGPPAPPIWGNKGNLYGVTIYGGIGQPACPSDFGCGVFFEMAPKENGIWTYDVMHKFASSPTDGQTPSGGLVMGAGGFYGVTEYGGVNGNGRIFRMSPPSSGETEWTETALYDFPNCNVGCLPAGTMVFDRAGNLYGVASGGKPDCGGYTCGVVFKLSPQANGSWSYSVVHAFTGTDGSSPVGVIVDAQGNIFGTTSNGGTYYTGVAFEIIP